MTFHMMFMSFLYSEFWVLKTFSYNKVERLCASNGKFENILAIYSMNLLFACLRFSVEKLQHTQQAKAHNKKQRL